MTAKALTKPVIHNAKNNIRYSMKISIVILALHLLGMPLVLANIMYNYNSHTTPGADDVFQVLAVCATMLAGASGIIIPMMNFRYLYNKSQVDMCLSAPMTRKQRFLSDYFSGLISYILPFLIAELVSGIMLLIGHLTMDGKTYTFSYMFASLEKTTYDVVCDDFATLAPFFGKMVLAGIIAMIMLYTLTVLVMVCCGTVFESILYNVFLNAAIPATLLEIYAFFMNDYYGVDLMSQFAKLLSVTSPAGIVYYVYILYSYNGVAVSGSFTYTPVGIWLIEVLVVILLLLALTYFLYMKRRAEQVSKPFVFKGLFYVILTVITFCISEIFLYNYSDYSSYIVTMIITTFVIYMLLEIISKRGFKRFYMSIIKYAATIAVIFGVSALFSSSLDIFGIEKKVPEASSVSKIYIGYNGIFNNEYCNASQYFTYCEGTQTEKDALNAIEITSEENINTIIEAHKNIVSKLHTSYVTANADLAICYVLKNGSKITRNYSVLPLETLDILKSVDISEEYKTQYAEYVNEIFANAYNNCEKDNSPHGTFGFTLYVSNAAADISDSYGYSNTSAYIDANSASFYVDKDFGVKLGEALKNDILDLTAEEYLTSSSNTSETIRLYSAQITISENYTRTMALLAEYGYTVKSNYEVALDIISNSGTYIKIIKGEDYKNAAGTDFISTAASYYGLYYNGMDSDESCNRYVTEYSDELMTILTAAKHMYITDKTCYTIAIGGTVYVIPEDHSKEAEIVYNLALPIDEETAYD